MRVLLTGGTGFLGSNILSTLCASDQVSEVYTFYRNQDKMNLLLNQLKYSSKIRPIKGSFTDATILKEMMNEFALKGETAVIPAVIDLIIHVAATRNIGYCESHQLETFQTNVDGTNNLVEFANKSNVKRVIYISTQSVYGNPLSDVIDENTIPAPESIYAKTKYMGELTVSLKAQNYEYLILRPTRLFGTSIFTNKDNFLTGAFPEKCMRGDHLTIYNNGTDLLNLIDVSDISRAIMEFLLTANKDIWNTTYNICGDHMITVNEIVGYYVKWSKSKGILVGVENKVADHEVVRFHNLTNQKIKSAIKWFPTIVEESIFDMLDATYQKTNH